MEGSWGLLPMWMDWLVLAQTANDIEQNSNRNTAIIVAAIGLVSAVLVAWIANRQRRASNKVEAKVDTALEKNTTEHQANTVHLLEIRRGMDLILSHQEFQDRQLSDIKIDAKKAAEKVDRIEDHLALQQETMADIKKMATETQTEVAHVKGDLTEHLGWADKVAAEIEQVTGINIPEFKARKGRGRGNKPK